LNIARMTSSSGIDGALRSRSLPLTIASRPPRLPCRMPCSTSGEVLITMSHCSSGNDPGSSVQSGPSARHQ
jgi:hypothetical protein